MKQYYCGLIKGKYMRKFVWQVDEILDRLSCEIYEFEKMMAKNKQEAVNILNKRYGNEYKGIGIKARPFMWGEGWW